MADPVSVLLVEDDVDLAQLTHDALARHGFDVTTATSFAAADYCLRHRSVAISRQLFAGSTRGDSASALSGSVGDSLRGDARVHNGAA